MKNKCIHCNKKLNDEELFYYGNTCDKCEHHLITLFHGSKFQIIISMSKLYFRKIISLSIKSISN